METQARAARGASIRLRLIAVFCLLAAVGLAGLASLYGFVAAGAPGIDALKDAAKAQHAGSLGLSALTFLVAAGFFLFCGLAARRERRWLPTILRSVGWIWLLTGALFLLLTVGMLDSMVATAIEDAAAPPDVAWIAKMAVVAMVCIGGLLLPTLLLALCSGGAMREFSATPGAKASWLDGVPEPVVGLSFAMALAALMVLPTLFAARLPIGPKVIGGAPAIGAGLTLFVLLALCAYWLFNLRLRGWWLSLFLVIALGVSALWTLQGMTVVELLQAMGYPDQSIATLSGLGSSWLVGSTIGVTLIGIGQLLWVRRHFGGTP